MRQSCQIVVNALKTIEDYILPGVKTKKIDKIANEYIRSQGGVPAFKDYQGYPANICISINDEVVHGIPGDRELIEGDIVSVDIGVLKNEYYGDSARTFAVGEISKEKQSLIEVAYQSLMLGIRQAFIKNRLYDISHAVQSYVESNNLSVVKELVGHGIGRKLHEEPQVPNYGSPRTGPRLRHGMVIAIEPMVNMGKESIYTLNDSWTIRTGDHLPSAHFEHTVAITNDGPKILTDFD